MSSTTQVVPATSLSRLETVALIDHQHARLMALLRSLTPDDWNAITDCAPWTVKDIVAHILGWAEAVTSPKEYVGQLVRSRRHKEQLADSLDRQNEVQVIERAHLSPDELLARLERELPRFASVRKAFGNGGRVLPMYHPVFGASNVAYVAGTIFTRDHFMHRIDISRATGADLDPGPRDARLLEDVIADWGRRTDADAHVFLTGTAGGSYRVGAGRRARIEGDAIEMARVMAGRGSIDDLTIEGDVAAATAWLTKGCPF